ncbi:MAG: histidine kinase [Cyclobacteriaceae bacterium]
MSWSTKSIRYPFLRYFLQWIGIPLLGGCVIGAFFCMECIADGDFGELAENCLISATFWTVLANGNTYLANLVDRRWTWLRQPMKRFAIGSAVLFVYTVFACVAILWIYVEVILGYDFVRSMNARGWSTSIVPGLLITMFIAIFMHGKEFLFAWRQAAIDNEKLKNQNVASQYESLKNQVNPHFLFNSLNALSSLVYSDQEKAVDFIRKLSNVYRYVLDHQLEEVVELKTELEFAKSFIYLNKIRFGDGLDIEIKGEEQIMPVDMIPPLAIQMLLENAFKHNIISRDQRLKIDILIAGDEVTVSNSFNPKNSKEASSGVGLNNIKSRFKFLTEKSVEVLQDDGQFLVILPILKHKE